MLSSYLYPMEYPETFTPTSREDLRNWLEKNHLSNDSIWLIYHKKSTGNSSLTWSEAVDEALCFGWIDSRRKTLSENQFIQYFCKRKAKSSWSKINKEKLIELEKKGLIHPAGYESIRIAKENGSWEMLDEAENHILPADLERAISEIPEGMERFNSWSKSIQKMALHWLLFAKKEETRLKRIAKITSYIEQNIKPKNFV